MELRLVSELMRNCRRSDKTLAEILGTSTIAVNRMIKKLEKNRYIRGYSAVPNFPKIWFSILAITFAKLNQPNVQLDYCPLHLGNYTFRIVAEPVPGEVDTTDNNATASVDICVTLPGNIDADTDVDIFDIVKLAEAYGTKTADPQYNPNCDINNDGDIDIFDIVIAASHYGESW